MTPESEPWFEWPKPKGLYEPYFPASFLAGSADLGHVVFEEELPLTADAPGAPAWEGHDNLYEWTNGSVRLVTYLPNGTPVPGLLAGATRNYNHAEEGSNIAQFRHAISTSGSRIFFEAEGSLYLREDGTRSVQLDTAETGAACPGGGGKFDVANAEGSRVFFTDAGKLTADSNATTGEPDLYEWRSEGTAGCVAAAGCLTDLTPATPSEPAGVLGVSGMNDGTPKEEENGTPYVYFVAKGALTSTPNSQGASALGPAQGTGTLIGPATGKGNLATGSKQVTGVSGGPFALGEVVTGSGAIPAGTTISACTPTCSTPSELTLSNKATANVSGATLFGHGSNEVTGLSTASGAFEAGMTISGAGIPAYTWIKAVGAGTLTLSSSAEASGTNALSASAANLYLRHGATTTFIAALNPLHDDCDWTASGECGTNEHGFNLGNGESGLTARTSTDGSFLGFNSVRKLTGYDNTGASSGEPNIEIYLYDASTNRLSCASCAPSGAAPHFGSAIHYPAGQAPFGQAFDHYPQRNVSDRGQVFFETAEALLPSSDTNGHRDVYEWEMPGTGACTEASPSYSPQDEGCLYLLSSGKSEAGSFFVDATPDGSNVFFSTAQSLLARDTDTVYDYYDAREGGGFASQSEAVAPPACDALEACQSPPSEPPAEAFAASATLVGAGNLPPSSAKSKAKPLTRAQKLAKALKACKRKPKRQRARCQAQARKRYGPKKGHKSTSRRAAR